ncbi:MAG: lysophospholipid acyltransferase family protein [Planctomycetota bacterium]
MSELPGRRITWRHRLEYGLVRAVAAVVAALPERFAYAVVGGAGRLFFRFAKGRRKLALRFLRQAYGASVPERDLMRLAAAATANFFKVGLDGLRLLPLVERGRLAERVEMGDLPQRFPPPPFLVLTAHLGCWEAGAMALATLGYDVHAVVKAPRNPLLDRWMVESRRRAGIHIHPRRGGIRRLARALAGRGVAAMVVDQNQRLRPVIAPFFGAPARCERSAAKLALRRGCPVVVAGVVRVGTGMHFRGIMVDPIELDRTGDAQHDLVTATTQINRALEALIRQAPDQYLWIHDRFRGAPAAEPRATQAEGTAAVGEVT